MIEYAVVAALARSHSFLFSTLEATTRMVHVSFLFVCVCAICTCMRARTLTHTRVSSCATRTLPLLSQGSKELVGEFCLGFRV